MDTTQLLEQLKNSLFEISRLSGKSVEQVCIEHGHDPQFAN